jgi:hypothetical protein
MKKYQQFISEDKEYDEYRKVFNALLEPLKELFYKEYKHLPDSVALYEQQDYSQAGSPMKLVLVLSFPAMDPHLAKDLETTSKVLKEQAFVIDNCLKFKDLIGAYRIKNVTQKSDFIKVKYRIDKEEFFSNPLIKSLGVVGKYDL